MVTHFMQGCVLLARQDDALDNFVPFVQFEKRYF